MLDKYTIHTTRVLVLRYYMSEVYLLCGYDSRESDFLGCKLKLYKICLDYEELTPIIGSFERDDSLKVYRHETYIYWVMKIPFTEFKNGMSLNEYNYRV